MKPIMRPTCTRYWAVGASREMNETVMTHHSLKICLGQKSWFIFSLFFFFSLPLSWTSFCPERFWWLLSMGHFSSTFKILMLNALKFQCSKLFSYLKYLCIYCVISIFFWCIPTRWFWNSTIYCPCVLSLLGVLCFGIQTERIRFFFFFFLTPRAVAIAHHVHKSRDTDVYLEPGLRQTLHCAVNVRFFPLLLWRARSLTP